MTGLPRSGTSLMMQLLHAGGMPCAVDGVRRADADNPRGYFELERVKELAGGDPMAVAGELRGRAVKIIHWLLFRLPAPIAADVIVMHRDLQEVLASQRAMLARHGRAVRDAERLAPLYARELQLLDDWLRMRGDLRALHVEHASLLDDPRGEARRIAAFLGRPLDIDAMCRAVDPSLHRQRARALEVPA